MKRQGKEENVIKEPAKFLSSGKNEAQPDGKPRKGQFLSVAGEKKTWRRF